MCASPSNRALGRAVAALRHDQGLTQADLAARTRLHRAYIGGIERGMRNPTWETLGAIADGLGVSMSDLVRRAEDD